MSQWTNEYAILRDLSVAQGRVPVAIERTVGAGDKPPSLNITEETEEEFFKHCSADADVTAAPDLGLIKKMLDMVRDVNVSSDDEECQNKVVVISKVNAVTSEFAPQNNNTSTPLDQSPKIPGKKKPVKRRQRNIALESILQAIADKEKIDGEDVTSEPMKLLKPNDFIFNNNVTEHNNTNELKKPVPIKQSEITAVNERDHPKVVTTVPKDIKIQKETSPAPTVVEKVTGWFKTQTENPVPKRTPKVTLEATTSMFKKKIATEKVKKIESTVKSPSSSNSGEYKPSVLANEYYQKYMEQSKFKESVRDDIWTKAEKKMKEIDEKRKREMMQASVKTSSSSTSQVSETEHQSFEATQSTDIFNQLNTASAKINRCLETISLPQHRHRLTGECVVCEVMTKRRTNLTNKVKKIQDDENVTECHEEFVNSGEKASECDIEVTNSYENFTQCHEEAVNRDENVTLVHEGVTSDKNAIECDIEENVSINNDENVTECQKAVNSDENTSNCDILLINNDENVTGYEEKTEEDQVSEGTSISEVSDCEIS